MNIENICTADLKNGLNKIGQNKKDYIFLKMKLILKEASNHLIGKTVYTLYYGDIAYR